MADLPGAHRLVLLPDLRLEVGDARGSTTARLGFDRDGLLLDVDDPVTLLRCAPSRGPLRDLPFEVPWELFRGTSVRLTSRGRALGRAGVTPAGGLRVVPTPAGLLVGVRALPSLAPAGIHPWWGAGLVAAAIAVVVGWRRRRH